MNIKQIRVGARVIFVPSHRISYKVDKPDLSKLRADIKKRGVITYVNHAHRFFRVEYPAGRNGELTLSECFKF